MNYKKIAEDNYKRFSTIEGNQYIATEYALKTILRLIEDFKVSSVLELGLGIGSISDTIFKYADANKTNIFYTGTEANEFCLEALPKNVPHYDKIHLYSDLSEVKRDRKYGLIIVDGSDEALNSIVDFATSNTAVFVEGWRGSQLNMIKEKFPNSSRVEIISYYKNPLCGPFDSTVWAGGGQLIFLDPSPSQKFYTLKEKIMTNLKYKLRKLKKIRF